MRSLVGRVAVHVGMCVAATSVTFVLAALTFDPLADLRYAQPPVPPEVIAARESMLGLDRPAGERLLSWWAGVFRGDFGITVSGEPVAAELGRRLATSLQLFFPGSVLAIVFGIAVGTWSAAHVRSTGDSLINGISLVLLAVPVFVLGTVIKLLWLPVNTAVGTDLLPFSGASTPGIELVGWPAVTDRLRHLVLPTVTILLPQFAFYSRYHRASVLDVMDSEFLRNARARGLRRGVAIRRHGLRMALIPVVALIAFSFGLHLTGGVFTERIFGWAGLGDWLLIGVARADANVVAASALLLSVVVAFAAMIAEALLTALDPRLRRRGRR